MTLDDQIAAVDNLLNQIKGTRHTNIDGRVLGTALELIYKCGLKEKEASEAKVKDVNCNEAGEPTSITIPEKLPVMIVDEMKADFYDYIEYLRSHYGDDAVSDSSLFPGYQQDKQFRRHLRRKSISINPRELRKTGIKRFHNRLIEEGMDEAARVQTTARQFRMSERSTKHTLTDTIQSAGTPKPTTKDHERERLLDYFEKISEVKSAQEVKALADRFTEFINHTPLFSYKKAKLAEKGKNDRDAIAKQFFESLGRQVANLPQETITPEEPKPPKLLHDIWKEWHRS